MDEKDEYIEQLETALQQQQNQQTQQGWGASVLTGGEAQNLVEWQLDFKKEKLDIERLLRKQVVVRDEEGNEVYKDPPPGEELFNERGVQAILELLSWYLNKNIVLSNFDEDTINMRVKQFAHALRRLVFLNYREFGLDTEYKQKHYETIVMKLVDVVEASYNRAYQGGERESLRTARMVTQNQPLTVMPSYPQQAMSMPRQKSRWFNPMSWGRM